jgi:hypothetical protein
MKRRDKTEDDGASAPIKPQGSPKPDPDKPDRRHGKPDGK